MSLSHFIGKGRTTVHEITTLDKNPQDENMSVSEDKHETIIVVPDNKSKAPVASHPRERLQFADAKQSSIDIASLPEEMEPQVKESVAAQFIAKIPYRKNLRWYISNVTVKDAESFTTTLGALLNSIAATNKTIDTNDRTLVGITVAIGVTIAALRLIQVSVNSARGDNSATQNTFNLVFNNLPTFLMFLNVGIAMIAKSIRDAAIIQKVAAEDTHEKLESSAERFGLKMKKL